MKHYKIKITSQIAEFLLQQHKVVVDHGKQSYYYMLGANEKGVCKMALLMAQGGGCHNVPGLDTQEITDTYVKLIREGLTPAALALVHWNSKESHRWDYPQVGDHVRAVPVFAVVKGFKTKRGSQPTVYGGASQTVAISVV